MLSQKLDGKNIIKDLRVEFLNEFLNLQEQRQIRSSAPVTKTT